MNQPQAMFLSAVWAGCAALPLVAQPARAIPTPNGEVYRVDESWFEKDPPFLEFYRLGKKDGLELNGSAYLLLQDSRGDIWLMDEGTNTLIRYDGHTARYFRPGSGDSTQLTDAIVDVSFGMVETPDGRLWVRHNKGLSSLDPRTERFQHFSMPLDSAENLPDLFFAGRQRPTAAYFDPVTSRFVRAFQARIIDATDNTRAGQATFTWLLAAGWQDARGHIWSFQHTSLGHGLVCVEPETSRCILYPMTSMVSRDKSTSPDYDPWITDMCPDASGENIWVAGWRGGLRRFNLASKRWTQFAQDYRRESGQVGVDIETTLFIHPGPDGQLWLGTAHGLSLFNPRPFRFSAWWNTGAPGAVEPGNHNLTNAISDRDGRLWLSEGNLMVHDEKRHFVQKTGVDFPSGRIMDVCYDTAENKTWLLKEDNNRRGDGGIYCLDENTGRLTAFTRPFFYDQKIENQVSLWGLVKKGGDLYFVSDYAVYRLNAASGRLTKIPIPAPPGMAARFLVSPHDICMAPDGSLWISITNTETNIVLVHYFPEANRFEYFRATPGGLTITAGGYVFADSQGRIWLTSNHTDRKGVNCYAPKSGNVLVFTSEPDNPYSLPNNLVYNLAEDPQGRIWMTTETGIGWYDPADCKMHRVPGFSGNNKFITIDRAGDVWVSGENSARFRPATGELRTFGAENGLHHGGIVLYTRKDGAVCFGPFSRVFPDKIPKLRDGPVVRLTGFKVLDREITTPLHIDWIKKIELGHADNTFSLSWSARNFTNPELDSFYYQLGGLDRDWVAVPATQLSVSYLKVAPGAYQFRLQCKNRDGVFGPEKTLAIRIWPAFYQTWWFKGLVAGILIAFFATIATLRQRQLRLAAELRLREAEFKQKEAELGQRLTEYQMAALRAQMNPHFVFNSLNSINRFVQMSEPDAASNYLTMFARLIRLVLDNSRSDVITLDDELEAVKLYLELESLRFAGQFDYRLRIDENADTEAVKVPPLFLQPYIENAIWHGLMQKEGPDKHLDIDIQIENPEMLAIRITDNGIGRARATELRSKSATRQKSHGMDITAERLQMFTERSGKKITIQIDDLQDEHGGARGTLVKILLET